MQLYNIIRTVGTKDDTLVNNVTQQEARDYLSRPQDLAPGLYDVDIKLNAMMVFAKRRGDVFNLRAEPQK